ncbi:hypothetical protein [Burkholderia plantarii]|uniref:hypothetical protein n=1 Tax=Burkholderia plantarii TaxID=41899 RepID=UPI00070623FD|nr:hypothetical protein [Burkholderia plantarii]ALK35152.1 hypothetical protein bpln_1p0060 [Burkholderia plantarii]GLZ22492.1 hypothetical protein Bpla01_60210 [Burkholderia plantarii]
MTRNQHAKRNTGEAAMNRSTKTTRATLTVTEVAATMRPGVKYTTSQLAKKLGAPISAMRQLLSSDVAIARFDMHSESKGRTYSLAGTCRAPDAHVDTRVRPDFTSNLSGYTRDLETHRALAMTTRSGPAPRTAR